MAQRSTDRLIDGPLLELVIRDTLSLFETGVFFDSEEALIAYGNFLQPSITHLLTTLSTLIHSSSVSGQVGLQPSGFADENIAAFVKTCRDAACHDESSKNHSAAGNVFTRNVGTEAGGYVNFIRSGAPLEQVGPHEVVINFGERNFLLIGQGYAALLEIADAAGLRIEGFQVEKLERRHTHRDVVFTVRIGAQPGRRFKWTFTTATGSTGSDITDRGREVACDNGLRAAQAAIDKAIDG